MDSSLAIAAVGVQSAKGTPNATPPYQHGLLGGAIINAEVEQGVDPQTSGTRMPTVAYRESIVPTVEFSTRMHKASVGLYLYALLGTKAVTGSEGAFTHVFTPGTALPYLTVAAKRDATEMQKVADVIFGEGEISWEGAKPLELSLKGQGTTLTPTFTPWVAGTLDETYLDSFLVPVGGSFKVSAAGESAAAEIIAGSISINNGTEPVMSSGARTPSDVNVGHFEAEVSFTVRVANFNMWRQILTGAVDGTTLACARYGAFEVIFKENCAADGASLKLEAPRVAFTTSLPDVDPGGGMVELELSGIALSAVSGETVADAVKATLANAVASY